MQLFRRQQDRPRNVLRWAAALSLSAMLALTASVRGQVVPWGTTARPDAPADANDGKFRSFPLRQMDAETARQQLTQFFGATPGVEIVADAPRGRVLVRGNPQVLQLAEQTLAKLDQPADAKPQAVVPPAPPTQQLEAYSLTPTSRTVLTALQNQAAGRPDVRVAVDERTAQALVLAPADVHTQIRNQLVQNGRESRVESREPEKTATQAASPGPQTSTPNSQPSNTPLQLRRLQADELRVRLERLLTRPLAASTDSSGRWQSYVIEATPGAGVTATVNPSTGELHLSGPPARGAAWRTVIEALDSGSATPGTVTQLVSTKPASQDRVRQVLDTIQTQNNGQPRQGGLVSMLMQQGTVAPEGTQAAPSPTQPATPNVQTAQTAADLAQAAGELLGPVEIQYVEGLDVIVLRGSERDVQRVMEIINQIEQLSAVTVPTIEVYTLQNVDSRSMAALLTRLYDQVLTARLGSVSITPLGKPNAVLLVGRAENVRMAIELIQRLDQPVAPTTRFEVFPLKHATASDAKDMIDEFLEQSQGQQQPQTPQQQQQAPTLAPRAMVVADPRTNSLIVSAGPRDLTEIAALLARIDAPSGDAVDQVRVFPLKNAVASEMADVLRGAIQGQSATTAPAQGQRGGAAAPAPSSGRTSSLEFRQIGGPLDRSLTSGVLTSARISADTRANSIIVTAPADSMDLIAALIEQLDQAPNVSAELKVFEMKNGDAETLTEMLRSLFGGSTDGNQQQGGGGGGGGGSNVGTGGLVRMQFSTDARTNSIIAAGTREDLAVVEAILLRLDEGDIRERVNVVYRLNNASAQQVADTLNQWLQTQRTAEQQAELSLSPFEQIEKEVIVVPEIATNSLVVSATPRYFQTVEGIIKQLDERPPMVLIQVMIAEVRLNDTDEFGVELGLQDKLLFDRSLVGDLTTTTNSVQTSTANGVVTNTTENIINAPLSPGFNFNNGQDLGNNGSTNALATAGNVAAQGLSNFSMGRVNSGLNFGGFVFSASSSGVNVLLRALQEKRRLEVLSRPQLMALDGQIGSILVGQRVPTITNVTLNTFGQSNGITYQQVGIIMQVQPRISPDGLVVMHINVEKSEVGPDAEGIPISISATGQIVRAPRINATNADTTVSALSGQTVVLNGLLTNRRQDVHRQVPLLGDIPLIGDLFRYDLVAEERTELLIIMTPQIIYTKMDSDLLKQVESSRMSYILKDVVNLHGEAGLRSRCDDWNDSTTEAVYPTYCPSEGEVEIPTENELLRSAPSEQSPIEGPSFETLPPPQPTQPRGATRPSPTTPSRPATADVTAARYQAIQQDYTTVQPARYAAPPARLPQPGINQ